MDEEMDIRSAEETEVCSRAAALVADLPVDLWGCVVVDDWAY